MRFNGSKFPRHVFFLALACIIFSTTTPLMPARASDYAEFKPFTFAYVTDIHLTNDVPDSIKLTHESQLFLQQLVKELNADKSIDFVVFGGDMVETVGKNETNWQLFSDCLQTLNAPWSFILGEQEVSGSLPIDKMKMFGGDWKRVGLENQKPYWSHNPAASPNIHLIGLDSSIPNSSTGGISSPQLEWLKEDLKKNSKFFTIIFTHHPLLPPPPYDSGPPWDDYVIPDGGAVREVIGAFPNVRLVLSGHLHVSKLQQEKEVWHVSNPSLAVFPCAYRVFNVTPEEITMETRQIGFPALVKKGRKELLDSSLSSKYSRTNPASFIEVVEGGREDRNAIIPLVAGESLKIHDPKRATKTKPEPVEEKPKQKTAKPAEEKPKKEKRGLFKKNKNKSTPEPEKQSEPSTATPTESTPSEPVEIPGIPKELEDLQVPAPAPSDTGVQK